MKLIVGIDFGTSTTVVRYRMENSDIIHSLRDADGVSEIIPSVIYRNLNFGTTEYGSQALMSAINDTDGNGIPITNFKMNLLDTERRAQAKVLIEEFLGYIHDLFTQQTIGLVYDSTEINISYPAKWDDTMVRIMKDAVANAGFQGQIYGRKEPEAATRNMLNEHLEHLRVSRLLGANQHLRIFMLDMGAGTTDISIFKLNIDEDGTTRITELLSYPSKEETSLCGGREIDLALKRYLQSYCEEGGVDPVECPITLHNVKYWKDLHVSPKLKEDSLPDLQTEAAVILEQHGHVDWIDHFSFNRLDFEHATKEHWKKLYSLIKSAMVQYRQYAAPEDIDFVCLTGGHSAWYIIPKLFNGEGVCNFIANIERDPETLDFRKLRDDPWRINTMLDLNPQESVARGLCLMNQAIIYDSRSSNNVWARITIDNVPGEITQVINKFEDIPVKKVISHSVNLSRNLVLDNLNIDMQLDIYTGETLENAEHRILKLNQTAGNLVTRILLAILGTIICNYRADIPTSVSMGITMTEEGLLEVDGKFTIWDDSSIAFTYNDLQLI